MTNKQDKLQALLRRIENPLLPGIELGLERVRALLVALGNPQEKLPPVVHVAGTNGKGSLIAYLRATLVKAGYRVHQYISPPLVRFHERIVLNNEEIDDDHLIDVLERVTRALDAYPVTSFEAITAAAFLAFSEREADVLLLETGMGGRLDATNLVEKPLLTAITPISIDHAEFLGNSLASIAGEKAGILKRGIPCVVGPQPEEALKVIQTAAEKLQVPLIRYGREWNAQKTTNGFSYDSHGATDVYPLPHLVGEHQIYNAATALACLNVMTALPVTKEDRVYGLTHAIWKARLQKLQHGPLVGYMPPNAELWLDGGHNPAAGQVLGQWAKSLNGKPLSLICGMMNTKDAEAFLKPLAPYVDVFHAVAIPGQPNSYPPHKLAELAQKSGMHVHAADSVETALKEIVMGWDKTISHKLLICGSLYLAGHICAENT